MEIPYTHINHVLVSPLIPDSNNILQYKPLVKFIEYLKSQIDYNIISIMYKRNILEYNNAYNYYKGISDNLEDYKKVIKYYYLDVSDVILNSKVEIPEDFSIIGNNEIPQCEKLEKVTIDVESVMEDLDNLLNGVDNIKNKHGLDYVKLIESIPARLDDFRCKRVTTEALLLRYFGSSNNVVYMEVI